MSCVGRKFKTEGSVLAYFYKNISIAAINRHIMIYRRKRKAYIALFGAYIGSFVDTAQGDIAAFRGYFIGVGIKAVGGYISAAA